MESAHQLSFRPVCKKTTVVPSCTLRTALSSIPLLSDLCGVAWVCRCALCDDPKMTDTFYVREPDPKHPGLNPNHPQKRTAEKQCDKNGARTHPGGVSPKRPNPAPHAPQCGVAEASRTWHDKNAPRAGLVATVFLGQR